MGYCKSIRHVHKDLAAEMRVGPQSRAEKHDLLIALFGSLYWTCETEQLRTDLPRIIHF